MRRTARRLYSGREVARALDRMAAELTPHLEHANAVVLAVMHGGAFTAIELCKRFAFAHEFDYVHVTRYAGDTRGGTLKWLVRPSRALVDGAKFVELDERGRGHCPLHPPDHNPSFVVDRERGHWTCFHEVDPRTGK